MDAVVLDEAYLRSVASGDEAPVDAEDVDFLRSVWDALAVSDGLPPSRELVAMAARAEGPIASVVEAMDRTSGELRQGAAAFAARHGGSEEEHQTLAAALLRKAAWVDGLRGEAAAALGAARGMQEDYLRRIAREEEDVVDQDDARAIEEASRGMEALMADGSPFVNSPEKAAAAAAISEAVAEGMAEEMAELARRIRAGAEAFGARPGEDRSLVSMLLSKAEAAERHGVQAHAMAAIFRRFRLSLPL